MQLEQQHCQANQVACFRQDEQDVIFQHEVHEEQGLHESRKPSNLSSDMKAHIALFCQELNKTPCACHARC
jgi:hypothetical protein